MESVQDISRRVGTGSEPFQTTATKYRTFVAMPFQERFSYRSREILSGVIGAAVDEANRRGQTPRQFDIPERIDVPMGAAVITEEIILRILESHIFMADVTFENAGVLLETGIALGTKAKSANHPHHSGLTW